MEILYQTIKTPLKSFASLNNLKQICDIFFVIKDEETTPKK